MSFNIFGAPTGFGWYPGFMIHESLSLVNAAKFFWYQFGLHAVLIPIGYCLAPRRVKIFMLPAFVVVTIAFLFRFSQNEVLVGHKFYNLFLILSQMLTAYVIVRAFDFSVAKFPRAKVLSFIMAGIAVFFLTLSGVIDMFPIINMKMHKVQDVGSNPKVKWYVENTPRDAVVLTSQFLYSPPSIAGRKIFLGYAYLIDSAGHDTKGRRKILDAIYSGRDRDSMCRLLRVNNISFVDVQDVKPNKGRPTVNVEFFRENFSPEFVSRDGRYEVYSTAGMCE
jgi:hypothetical protein